MLHSKTLSLDMFWRKWWLKRQEYLELCWKSLKPLKRVRLKSKPDCVFQLNCGGVCTYASCKTTSNMGEFQPPRSIKNASPVHAFQLSRFEKLSPILLFDLKISRFEGNICKFSIFSENSNMYRKLLRLLVF